jgi:hypothetical protein
MKPLKDLSEIDTNSKEGKYLIASLAVLTTQPVLKLNGVARQGTHMTPDDMLNEVTELCLLMYDDVLDDLIIAKEPATFESSLQTLINKFSLENESNTPDFVLAKFLRLCLDSFNEAANAKEKYHGTISIIN